MAVVVFQFSLGCSPQMNVSMAAFTRHYAPVHVVVSQSILNSCTS